MNQNMNISDKNQVKKARRKQKLIRENELNDLKVVMSTPAGRRFVWRILEKCRVFGSIWESSAKIHYNSGQQDLGHFVMAEIVEADEALLFNMMTENKTGEKNEQ